LGLSKTGAGVLTAAFGVGTLAGSIPAGMLAARTGPKPVALTGLALLSVTSLAFGFAHSIAVLDAARFCQGFGGACTWTGALAWLVSRAPRERRGELIGSALGAGIAGALLGPIVGGAAASFGTGSGFSAVAAVAAGLESGLSPVVGRLADRRGSAALVRVAALGSAAVTVLLPLLHERFALGTVVVGAGLAYGVFWIPAMTGLIEGAESLGLDASFA